jgi:acyl-coenzyme A synthetase/AMP-(fatty) acid ligase
MFEGVPTWPDAGRFWKIDYKFKVDILFSAPTAILLNPSLVELIIEGAF